MEFDELLMSISNSNFAGHTGGKNLVQTRQKFQFIKLDFSNLIFQNPSADRYRLSATIEREIYGFIFSQALFLGQLIEEKPNVWFVMYC